MFENTVLHIKTYRDNTKMQNKWMNEEFNLLGWLKKRRLVHLLQLVLHFPHVQFMLKYEHINGPANISN